MGRPSKSGHMSDVYDRFNSSKLILEPMYCMI